jgi:glycerol-3-phosphate dehydrogenase
LDNSYDLLVIGGGINGTGIARDAVGRGLKVALCERGDLAGATSSASSKLIHGGLRYLESYEFRLVREALGERETLLNIAPHIIWPLRFVLPVTPGMRPAWMLRVGLFIYDYLAKRNILPGTKTLNLRRCLQGQSLKESLTKAFEYSDCWADDARLVALNAVDASERGAKVMTRTECTELKRGATHWTATLMSDTGVRKTLQARAIVNAAGPWVDDIMGKFGQKSNTGHLRLVKGSHIITKKLFEGEHAYIFQSPDKRVIFAIPYETDFTLIGTTEQNWVMGQGKIEISESETNYLCETASSYFKKPVTRNDIVWSYAGVRPLFDDKNKSASVVTRDYVFQLDDDNAEAAPILSIFGGKLTTYRKLAEHAMDKLAAYYSTLKPAWTNNAPLPGGDFTAALRGKYFQNLAKLYPWLPSLNLARLAQSYGTRLPMLIGNACKLSDLGRDFGAGLYEAEIDYLCKVEFAQSAEDILWRRTKLGLRLSALEQADLSEWFKARVKTSV